MRHQSEGRARSAAAQQVLHCRIWHRVGNEMLPMRVTQMLLHCHSHSVHSSHLFGYNSCDAHIARRYHTEPSCYLWNQDSAREESQVKMLTKMPMNLMQKRKLLVASHLSSHRRSHIPHSQKHRPLLEVHGKYRRGAGLFFVEQLGSFLIGCLHGPLQDVASFEYGPRVVQQQSFSCAIQTLMANHRRAKVSLLGTSCDNECAF